MTTCPDIKTAVRLWVKSIDVMSEWIQGQYLREYIYHTETIAENAAKIASRCHLDEQKAYVLGLLHDYGKKTNQKISGKSHFMTGYDELSAMGWSDVARINLTHSFPEKDFDYKDYSSYPLADLQRAKALISQLDYDDYDKLIQLCDMFAEATSTVSYQKRLQRIRERYGLKEEQTIVLERKAAENKAYFDAKCGCDIYDLLRIEY